MTSRAADRVIARMDEREQDTQRLSHDWGQPIRPSLRSEQELTRVSEIAGDGNRVSSARTVPMRVEIGQTRARLGASVEAGSIDLRTEAERAVDKYWGKYLLEIAKLQQAVDGIAVKESK